MGNIHSLEQLGSSGSLLIDNIKWDVIDREVYQDNSVEKDIQWTIESDNKDDTHYLILSQSKEGQAKLREVLITHSIEIGDVNYQTKDDKWTTPHWAAFKEKDSLATPPEIIRYGQEVFELDDSTSDRAVDDDGNKVERLTWDYYNKSRSKNLTIEVWKEEDADYYEAYIADLIDERYIKFLDEEVNPEKSTHKSISIWKSIKSKITRKNLRNLLILIPIVFFAIPFWFSTVIGCPLDIIISFYVPLIMVFGFLIICEGDYLPLLKAMPMALAIIPLMIIKTPSYYYVFAFFACGYVLNKIFYGSNINIKEGKKIIASTTATFISFWLASFFHYFKYAPAMHTAEEFLITLAIPIIGTVICSTAYYFVEKA